MIRLPKTLVLPGAIDLHVHFRQPGDNKAETIASGSKAALMGGFVLVCDMPNNPGNPTWTDKRVQQKQRIMKRTSYIPMATYAGSQPEFNNLDELGKMSAQSIGLKLYGEATTGNHIDYEPGQFNKIVKKWHQVAPAKPIMLHSGKDNLQEFINLIAKKNKHPLHVCHIFSAKHGRLVVNAKKRGLSVTSAVCPHHILKTSYHTLTEGWFTRMQPPPLHQDEAEELFKMFAKGEIDTLETDHAPHTAENKWAAERDNPEAIHDPHHLTCFGVPGIEFALSLLFYQVKCGRLSLKRLLDATSIKPARIIGIKLSPSTKVTWDMKEYRIGDEPGIKLSGSGWTPYLNNLAVGKVQKVKIGNKIVVRDGKISAGLPRIVSQRGGLI